MPFLQELLGGGRQKPTAQELAGGIPQNADPGKRRFGDFAPPPVTAAPQMDMSAAPAQLKPQQAPIAPVASPPAQMGPMGASPMGGGASPMGGGGMVPPGAMNTLGDYASQPPPNPTMQQALMERLKQLQAGGR